MNDTSKTDNTQNAQEHIHQSDGSTVNPSRLICRSCGETYSYDNNLAKSLMTSDTQNDTQLDKILDKSKEIVTTDYSEIAKWSATAHLELTEEAKQALRDLMLDELIKELKELADPGPWGHEIKEYGDGDSRSVIQVSEITDRITELTAQKGTK